MSRFIRLGLKLYSTNTDLIPDAIRILEENICHYIELYIIPDTYETTVAHWQNCHIPFVIHAPHSVHGINFAVYSQWEKNRERFMDAQRFANKLNAEIIIVHAGHSGSINETIRQIALLNDGRICLENKPKVGLNNENCMGWSPDEFRKVADAGLLNAGTVLDFGHAVCAAISSGKDPMEFIREFLVFKPRVFHLSDGDAASERDTHLNIGDGNFNVTDFLSVVPENGHLTLETPRDHQNGINDFVKDICRIRELFLNRS